jgi:hypothetical protein
MRGRLYGLGKLLEGLGLVLVLVGVVLSMRLGFRTSPWPPWARMTGFPAGGVFLAGWLLERASRPAGRARPGAG